MDKWDMILITILVFSIILAVVEVRVKSNIIYDRSILDFTSNHPDEQLNWESASPNKQMKLGVLQMIEKIVLVSLIATVGLLTSKLLIKAGWFKG